MKKDYIERVNESRKDLMERTRAATDYINRAGNGREDLQMSAFLDLFHPNMSEDKKRELVNDQKNKQKNI